MSAMYTLNILPHETENAHYNAATISPIHSSDVSSNEDFFAYAFVFCLSTFGSPVGGDSGKSIPIAPLAEV